MGETETGERLSLEALLERFKPGGTATVAELDLVLNDLREKTTRNGKPYHELLFADRSGSQFVRDFNCRACEPGGVYTAVLRLEEWNGGASLKLDALRPSELDADTVMGFDHEWHAALIERLRAAIASLAPESFFGQLVREMFAGAAIERFIVWPAAVHHHHNYKGGLLEHTLEVLDYALALGTLTEGVDRELLTAACLIHDIGKLDEYEGPPRSGMSQNAEFAYHLAFGQVRLGSAVGRLRERGAEIPYSEVLKLVHCIEMSHGEYRLDKRRDFQFAEARLLALSDQNSAHPVPPAREAETAEAR